VRISALIAFALVAAVTANAAELTTGAILGSVTTNTGKPLPDARIVAVAPSGRYVTATDSSGRFVILGVVADTYQITAEAKGYQTAADVAVVLPGERDRTGRGERRGLLRRANE
jgi:hypothetical protein